MNKFSLGFSPFLILFLFFASCSSLLDPKTASENPDRSDFMTPVSNAEQLKNEQTPTPLSETLSPTNIPMSLLTQQPNKEANQANSNTYPEEILRIFYEMLDQKECAAAYDLFISQRAWVLSKEDYLTTCKNNYSSVEIVEIYSLSEWVTEARCTNIDQRISESDTRRSFFLKEKWTVRPENSEKIPSGLEHEQVVPFWVSIEFENGNWKIGHFFSNPPCDDDNLNWETTENNLFEARDTPSPQTPEDVIKAYYSYFTGKQCLAAYNLLGGEAAGQNPKDDAVSFCQFDPRTWELVQITPYSEWCQTDDNVWDNETQRKFYVKVRLMGHPMFIGKGITGFVMEQFYELTLSLELINNTWRVTQIDQAYPRQCHIQP